jgi:ATP-binding cassette subfamily F protein 2
MSSKWHEKQEKKRLEQLKRDEDATPDETVVKSQVSAAAMGGGEEELFEKKLSKEEKKALAKAKREAKKNSGASSGGPEDAAAQEQVDLERALMDASSSLVNAKDLSTNNAAAERLAAEGTICTFAVSRKGVDARSRDINIANFTMQHKGNVMLDATDIVLNHGNRYGLIGRNGCGKSTFLKALGTRSVPIPDMVDLYFLKEEVEARKDLTALEAVMSVDEEREKLEKQVENLNMALASLADNTNSEEDENTSEDAGNMTVEEQQESIMDLLNTIYERLDALDASTAETRARSILKGLGFTHEMQVGS